jgi:Response regulators consisting of a CheY-like receiver domain and a winged-helix DNA-binding domain
MKRSILIVEDNAEMSEIISMFLHKEGFDTVPFPSAEEAYDHLSQNKVDLIILDINLPGIDGYEFLMRIRKFISTPVLIVTARQSNHDVITGLGYGADDFVSKPFSSEILIARIRALIRRSEGQSADVEKTLSFGPYVFHPQTLELFKGDLQVSLSTRECRLLKYFIENAGKYMNPETIYENVWRNKYGDLTVVAVYVQKLRRKIEENPAEPAYIKTQFGMGYGFIMPDGKDKKER